MIIFILIIAVITFIYFNVIPGKGHNLIAWLALIVLGASVFGIVAHDHNHLGMKEKTYLVKKQLVSSVNPQLPILLYQPLGNGHEKVYLYKNDNFQKKPTAIQLDQTTAQVKQSNIPAVEIKTTRYVYQNQLSSIMFGLFGHNNELKKRQYTFFVPKTWKIMTPKQLKLMQMQLQRQKKMQMQIPPKS